MTFKQKVALLMVLATVQLPCAGYGAEEDKELAMIAAEQERSADDERLGKIKPVLKDSISTKRTRETEKDIKERKKKLQQTRKEKERDNERKLKESTNRRDTQHDEETIIIDPNEPTPQPKPQPVVEPTPQPQPVVEPTPQPQPVVEPTPQPQPQPVVEPTPQPQPQPVVEPTPQPQPQPVVEPTPQPQPQPQPVVEPTPQPKPQPVVEPTPQPQPQPVVEPTPQPQPQPVVEPTPQPKPPTTTTPTLPNIPRTTSTPPTTTRPRTSTRQTVPQAERTFTPTPKPVETVEMPSEKVVYANFVEVSRAVKFVPLYMPRKSGYEITAIYAGQGIVEIRYGRRWEPTVSLAVRTYKRADGEEPQDISGVTGVKWRIDTSTGTTIYIAKVSDTEQVAAWAVGQYTFSAHAENLSFAGFHSLVADELVELSTHYYLNLQ